MAKPSVNPIPATDADPASSAPETPEAQPKSLPSQKNAAVMETILAERMKMLADDGVDTARLTKADEEPDVEAELADGESRPEEVVAAETGKPPPAADDKMVTVVNVDGVETQVSVAELRQNYQIGSAARQALERAAAKERAADEKLRTASAAAPPVSAAPAEPAATKTTTVPDIDWTEKAKELQFGTPEEAGKVLEGLARQLVESRGPAAPAIDPDQLVMRAVLIAQDNAEFNGALTQFGNDYKDIFEGIPVEIATMGGQMAHAFIQRELQAAQKESRSRRPYSELFGEAGERMRSIVGQIRGPGKDSTDGEPNPATPGTPKVAIDPSKMALKRASLTPPAAAGTAFPVGTRPRAAPEVTPEEIAQEGVREIMAAQEKRRGGRLPAA